MFFAAEHQINKHFRSFAFCFNVKNGNWFTQGLIQFIWNVLKPREQHLVVEMVVFTSECN